MFDDIIQYYYLVPIFSMLIVTITFGVNNWDITTLENKLMTNFKKIQILFSSIVIETIVFSIFIGITTFILNGIPANLKNVSGKLNLEGILPFLIVLVIFSLGTSMVFHLLMYLVKKIFFVKPVYYVILSDSEEKWYLERRSSKSKILISNRKGEYLFLSEWENKIFKTELAPLNHVQRFIFSSEARYNKILFTLFLSLVVLYLIYIYANQKFTTLETCFLVIGMVFLFIILLWLEKAKKFIFIRNSKESDKKE